jgi:hypothetical protein
MPELKTRCLEWPPGNVVIGMFLGMFIYMSAYACSIWWIGTVLRKRPYSLTIFFWYLNLRELYGGVVSATYFAWYHNIFMIILIVLGPQSEGIHKGEIVCFATIGRCCSYFLIYWFPDWTGRKQEPLHYFICLFIHLFSCIILVLAVVFVLLVLRVLVSRFGTCIITFEAHRPVNLHAPPPLVLSNPWYDEVIIKDPHDSKCFDVVVASACLY